MSVYTVHEPPFRRGVTALEPERFAFVRDGFSLWAFLLAPLWMLRHRMWLVLLLYLAVSILVDVVLRVTGTSEALVVFIGLLIALLVGLEAGTLRRFSLGRRGWRSIGIVTGEDREDAERRFFDGWLGGATSADAAAATAGLPPPIPVARAAQDPHVIGLFPEPGANR